MARTALILGGTGQIGQAIALHLVDQGWHVRLASRGHRSSPASLSTAAMATVQMDRDMPGELATALGDGVDALIDTIALDAGHADQLAEVQADVGAFVVISSASVYRDATGRTLDEAGTSGYPQLPVPVNEEQPTVEPGPQTYSTRKIALEHRLQEQIERPVTILRPGAVYGPYSTHPREWWFVKRMLDRRSRIPLAGGGTSQFHTTASPNLAALTSAALDAERSPMVLNAADPTAPSVLDIGRSIAECLGWEGEFVPQNELNGTVGLTPWSLPHPLVLDTSRADSIGYAPVADYATAVATTCEWLRHQDPAQWQAAFPVLASYGFPLFDYDAEDLHLRVASRHEG